jgi:hypothetical protein
VAEEDLFPLGDPTWSSVRDLGDRAESLQVLDEARARAAG